MTNKASLGGIRELGGRFLAFASSAVVALACSGTTDGTTSVPDGTLPKDFGKACKAAGDCEAKVCGTDGKCKAQTQAPVKPPVTDIGKTCSKAEDCTSGVCPTGEFKCKDAASNDGVKNQKETDVDCGGPFSPACGDGKKCEMPRDCASVVCGSGTCQAPSATDGMTNGKETDVDCGGINAPACATGKACEIASDCTGRVCTDKVCRDPAPADNVKNGTETDVDCGGGAAPACADGKTCVAGTDCTSGVCGGNVCRAPSFTDSVKNGDESDVDCGGASASGAQKCDAGKICAANRDCKSDGCGDDGKCAEGRSCTQLHGGRTCGAGEFGGANARHESCCKETLVPTRGVYVDKYMITAGRMRAFLERVNGNVRDAVRNDPKWVGAWTQYLPSNMAEAMEYIGPVPQTWDYPMTDQPNGLGAGRPYKRSEWVAKGCQIEYGGSRTYWQPPRGNEQHKYSQDVLDEKAMNCTNIPLNLAFCIWDGKDLLGPEDYRAAAFGGDGRKYPWGNAPAISAGPTGLNPNPTNPIPTYLANMKSYQFPAWIASDASAHVAAPGRHPAGNGPYGHADMMGLMYEQARVGATTYYTIKGSWELHPGGSSTNYFWSDLNATNNSGNGATVWNRRYYAIGARCGRR